jgi:hypothetical protein
VTIRDSATAPFFEIRWAPVAIALALTSLALTACSPQNTEDQPAATPAQAVGTETRTPAVPGAVPTTTQPAPTETVTPESGTVGGDGSQIQLSGLTLADRQSHHLDGELGCGFNTREDTGGADPLLTAMGFSGSKDAAQGLVKVTGFVERIAAPGGFDGLVKGATFTGAGKTITIAVTGKATGGGESPAYPATLTYQRADGAERAFVGTWTCGP